MAITICQYATCEYIHTAGSGPSDLPTKYLLLRALGVSCVIDTIIEGMSFFHIALHSTNFTIE